MKYLILFLISFNLFAYPDGINGDALVTDGSGNLSWGKPGSVFIPGTEIFYYSGSAAMPAGGPAVFLPFWPVTPTRTKTQLGDSADIVSRDSDMVARIVNSGIHRVELTFNQDEEHDYWLLINGDVWSACRGDAGNDDVQCKLTFEGPLNANDLIRFNKSNGNTSNAYNFTFSVTRLSI